MTTKILCVVGARPNFMKIAPIMTALRKSGGNINALLIHTGQHYDEAMNERFFQQLGIPRPDEDLEVGSGSHAVQTAEIMKQFEPVVDREKPRGILVVGDVNSTIACALVAVKKGISVIHVEAGLRSYDRNMPEEINRVLTDQISDLLFTTEKHAQDHLVREGIDPMRIHFVGNVMIDTLRCNLERSLSREALVEKYHLPKKFLNADVPYGVLTLHRPSNVDDEVVLAHLLKTLNQVSQRIPILFPMHPRTKHNIEKARLWDLIKRGSIVELPPIGYLDMLGLMRNATLVLTDSGGIQEETTALGVNCITLRENTERPVTVSEGTNVIVGTDSVRIIAAVEDVLAGRGKAGRIPELWDGHAAERIADIIARYYR